MKSRIRFHSMTAALSLALSAATAGAGTLDAVGSTVSGYADGTTVLTPTLTVTRGASSAANFNAVIAWDFRLDWDEAKLQFDPTQAMIAFGSGGADAYSDTLANFAAYSGLILDNISSSANDGYLFFSWMGNAPIDLGPAVNFTGAFTIKPGSMPGNSLIVPYYNSVASGITDEDLNGDDYPYPGAEMRVTVLAQPAPEPGMLVLLLGGVGAYLGAMRLRRRCPA